MGIGLMMFQNNRRGNNQYTRNHDTPHQTYGYAENFGDDHEDMEMRRRRRSAYERGYEDAMIDEEARRRRSHWKPEEEMRGAQNWGDSEEEMEMRRRRRGQMGFDVSPRQEMEEMRTEMHHMKKMQEKLMEGGYASVKKLAPNLEGVLEDAAKTVTSPPQTWPPYLQRGDLHGIARMEGEELMKALKEHKPAKDIRKELVHTIAALMLLVSE